MTIKEKYDRRGWTLTTWDNEVCHNSLYKYTIFKEKSLDTYPIYYKRTYIYN